MDCSTLDFPVLHHLMELIPTPVHWVGDAIQPSHPLLSPSPPAPNPSQHQGLFQWVNSLHEVAKVLELQLQHQSFQWTPRTDLLEDWMVWSPCSTRDSLESSPTPQFKSINSSVLSFLYNPTLIHTWLLEKPIALTRRTFVGKVMSLLLNMLSRFVIAFLPRSIILISWLSSMILDLLLFPPFFFLPQYFNKVFWKILVWLQFARGQRERCVSTLSLSFGALFVGRRWQVW